MSPRFRALTALAAGALLLSLGCCRLGLGRTEPYPAAELEAHVRDREKTFGAGFTVIAVPPFVVVGDGPPAWVKEDAAEVVGVAAKEAPVMALSFDAGRAVDCDRMATFADGLAVRVAIPTAVGLIQGVVDRMLLVSERAIAEAVGAYDRAGIRAEGAAASALAALPQLGDSPGPVVLVVTGRNIDDALHRRAVQDPGSFPD